MSDTFLRWGLFKSGRLTYFGRCVFTRRSDAIAYAVDSFGLTWRKLRREGFSVERVVVRRGT